MAHSDINWVQTLPLVLLGIRSAFKKDIKATSADMELSKCSHAFLKQGPFLKALQPPYTGPYEIMDRNTKTITLKICNKPTKVSIDRVKPASILQDDVTPVPVSVPDAVPTEPIPVPVSIPDSVPTEPIPVPVLDVMPTEPTQIPERTTRFGRRVKFRDILNL
ncbi:uncharacterized protein LOC131675338 [Phymastichus coffea]|uniref:uncharacterized protein LOC131675338 n=1 Tax=Phymastichus coffea TaxID=108790 RepID=UPI00273CA99D|nr:uncharacterized protein LOC131675338 [Phymastichus coffea]